MLCGFGLPPSLSERVSVVSGIHLSFRINALQRVSQQVNAFSIWRKRQTSGYKIKRKASTDAAFRFFAYPSG